MSEAERDYAVEAENTPKNRARIARRVRAGLKRGGLHLYPQMVDDVLAEIVIDELAVLRKRTALMMDLARAAHEGEGLTDTQLERLAFVTLVHFLDENGEIRLPRDVEEE